MVKELRKRSEEDVGVSLGKLVDGLTRGIGGLLGFAAHLERQGKSEYAEYGEIAGKTKSGKEIKGTYGVRVRIGLHPAEGNRQKRLLSGSE